MTSHMISERSLFKLGTVFGVIFMLVMIGAVAGGIVFGVRSLKDVKKKKRENDLKAEQSGREFDAQAQEFRRRSGMY